jgi:hypothetical protein
MRMRELFCCVYGAQGKWFVACMGQSGCRVVRDAEQISAEESRTKVFGPCMYGALFMDYGARVSTGFGADDGGLRELFLYRIEVWDFGNLARHMLDS